MLQVFSSPGELIGWNSSRHPCVGVSVHPHSNINIAVTSGLVEIKFYLKNHWSGGKAALGFWPDRIRTLVSMATDSSHRVIMGKMLWTL